MRDLHLLLMAVAALGCVVLTEHAWTERAAVFVIVAVAVLAPSSGPPAWRDEP